MRLCSMHFIFSQWKFKQVLATYMPCMLDSNMEIRIAGSYDCLHWLRFNMKNKYNLWTYLFLQAGEKHQLPQLTKKGGISLDDIVAMLIRVFVDASPHIPEHRQLPLFTHLISTLGSLQFLHTAVLLLLERHVVHGASNPDGDKQVCVEVSHRII